MTSNDWRLAPRPPLCYNEFVMPPRDIIILPDAKAELAAVALRERLAVDRAISKLAELGEELGYPHTSAVQGAAGSLRELRPRQGRCRVRVFYRRVGEYMVVAAIGPEAQVDGREFNRATAAAQARLAAWEREA